jgi:hypothetical protein
MPFSVLVHIAILFFFPTLENNKTLFLSLVKSIFDEVFQPDAPEGKAVFYGLKVVQAPPQPRYTEYFYVIDHIYF